MAAEAESLYRIILKAKNKDSGAMQYLISKFTPILKKYAYKLGYEDAYDDLQLFFIELVYNIDFNNIKSKDDGALTNYLNVSVYNHHLMLLRKYTAKEQNERVFNSEEEKDVVINKEGYIDDHSKLLFDRLDTILNETEAKVIKYIFYDNLSIKEVSILVNKTQRNVYKVKAKRLKKLKRYLQE